jgi:hypothetical protein
MRKNIMYFFLFILFVQSPRISYSQNTIKHFIFFSQERDAIHDSSFYLNPGISGAQITYPWKILEPQKDHYDFHEIEEDLTFLNGKGKELFIQIQDVTFDSLIINVPEYLLRDTIYHGGVNSQYDFINGDESKPVKAGWVSRRWDIAVAYRFHQLLFELGKKFDGKIEGINLPETSVEFGNQGNLYPPGFTCGKYLEAIKSNMFALKQAFHISKTIQYANFMPGEFLPYEDRGYIKGLYEYAHQIKVGAGGPDILVYRKAQMDNSYGLIRNSHGFITTGMAVQEGNYDIVNPQTGKQVTVPEILDFTENYLKLDYIFWCTQEPYYSDQVLPLIKSMKK